MRTLSRVCADRPRLCLAVLSLLTVVFAAGLPHVELRTDGAALHPPDHPTVLHTRQDRATFDDPEELILLVSSPTESPAVTSLVGLRSLVELHHSIATLAGIDSGSVRSAASLVDVASSDFTSLEGFLDEIPEDSAEREALLRRLRDLPWTDGLFLSRDDRAAVIYAPLEAGGDRQETVHTVERWIRARETPFELRLTGPVVAETLLGRRVLEDLARLVPLMVGAVALLLGLCLRTVGGVLIALGKALVVLVWTGGVMGLAGVPLTLVTTILPVLLLALCVTDEVHVLARLQERLRDSPENRREALVSTLDELYRPVAYTSISTALGFLSFLSASIEPLRGFGALAAVGILTAMTMTFTWTPALGTLLPRSWLTARRDSPPSPSPRRFGRQSTLAFGVGAVLLLAAIPGLLRLTVQDSWIDNFDPQSSVVQAERELDDRFWGSYRFDLVLSGPAGHFHRPEGVELLAEIARSVDPAPNVGGVVTALEPLATVAELLGVPGPVTALSEDALAALARVASAYPEKTLLPRLSTADGRATRLLLVVHDPDYQRSRALAENVEATLAPLVAEGGVTVHASGDLPLAVATVGAVVRDQLRSIAWTLAGVGLLLLIVNRSWWLTLIQLVPPTAAAWLILGAMGYAGLPLGVATSLFTALTLGVGVDLALHVTYAYDDARRGLPPRGGESRGEAMRQAFARTAAGRRWSTLVLSLGFLVLTASAFEPNRNLGLLLAGAMVTAYLATSMFLPRMLTR